MEEKIVLNGKEVTKEELNEAKEKLQKGMELVEVSPGIFKTRLHD